MKNILTTKIYSTMLRYGSFVKIVCDGLCRLRDTFCVQRGCHGTRILTVSPMDNLKLYLETKKIIIL